MNYTNNYTSITSNYMKMGLYRIGKQNGKLSPYEKYDQLKPLPGSVYNIDSFQDIKSLTLTYSSSYSNGVAGKILYGNTFSYGKSKDIEASTTLNTLTFDLEEANYFRIQTYQSCYLTLTSIVVNTYDSSSAPSGMDFDGTGVNDKRAAVTSYTGTLEAGTSYVNVPTDYSIDEASGKYIVTGTKKLTYYTYSYVKDHSSDSSIVNDAMITNPKYMAAYYAAFNTYPANFYLGTNKTSYTAPAGSGTKTQVKAIFNETYQVSRYNYTTGYVKSLSGINTSGSFYYDELDFNLAGNYSSSRGVGRVVVFPNGITNYKTGAVSFYTDDHYLTFQEFNNLGEFNTRFNGNQTVTSYVHTPSKNTMTKLS